MTTTANNKPKITIQGVLPQFDESELKHRQQAYHSMYLQTSQCMEQVRATIPYDFLTKVAEKVMQGYVIALKQPITTLPLDYSAYLVKPPELQQADLIVMDEQLKQEYIAEIETKRAAFKQQLKQQLLQKAESDEQAKIDNKRAKLLADIEKEVENTFTPLVIPA
jgi:hypothetical protein